LPSPVPSLVTFYKYEGTANDFVVLEGGAPDLDLAPETVARLCDRHRGIGADGVLLVLPPKGNARAKMVVRNADGSRPEMCGNGVRCVALHLATRDGDVENAASIDIETDAGVRTCHLDTVLESDEGELESFVTVEMGRVTVGDTLRVTFEKREFLLTTADAGNPHAVMFEPIDDAMLDALGAHLQRESRFPHGVNLERVAIRPAEGAHLQADVAVFERGVGRTLACGTGACAVAAVLVQRGAALPGQPVEVFLPGGPLRISLAASGAASMRGPARRVFEGRVPLPSSAWRRGSP
jgi:diaminopimelate epimerase